MLNKQCTTLSNVLSFCLQKGIFSNFDWFWVRLDDCVKSKEKRSYQMSHFAKSVVWTLTARSWVAGRYQSMKPIIGKSIDQSMTIDALLVNWHRLASANRWPIDNHTKVVATHRLSSIGVEKISVSHTFQPVRIRTRSTHKCLTFEFVHRIVCMLLHGFKNQQQKHALKQCFEETQVNNTPFRLAVPFAVLYTVDVWLIWFLVMY